MAQRFALADNHSSDVERLAANPRQLARNLVQQFTVYATGTPVRFGDRSDIESLLDANAASGYRVRNLLHSLVESHIVLGPVVSK